MVDFGLIKNGNQEKEKIKMEEKNMHTYEVVAIENGKRVRIGKVIAHRELNEEEIKNMIKIHVNNPEILSFNEVENE